MCGQVWWPILGICPLHLTHPSAHSQQWTHTWSSGQPYCGARGAVGGSVPCSRVSPQSWYWRWREHLLFTPPTDNPCRTWESNRQPLGYKSNSLTIRPRLPQQISYNKLWFTVVLEELRAVVRHGIENKKICNLLISNYNSSAKQLSSSAMFSRMVAKQNTDTWNTWSTRSCSPMGSNIFWFNYIIHMVKLIGFFLHQQAVDS